MSLSATTVASLKRIVPDTAVLTNVGRSQLDSSLLDSLVGLAPDTTYQLPLPVEDFSGRQASDPLSTVRVDMIAYLNIYA